MVPCERILATAVQEGVNMIGLSGLITPSLDEMVHVAGEMQRQGFEIPLLIGGATTSAKHTAVKIAPAYRHATVHVLDASRSVGVVDRLNSPDLRADFEADNRRQQRSLVESYNRRQQVELTPYQQARARRFATDWRHARIDEPGFLGAKTLADVPLEDLVDYIDWSPFFLTWELKGKYPKILTDPHVGEAARKLFDDARNLLGEIIEQKSLSARAVYGFWPAASIGDDIAVYADASRDRELARFHTIAAAAQGAGELSGAGGFRGALRQRASRLSRRVRGHHWLGRGRARGPLRGRPRRLQRHSRQGAGRSARRGAGRILAPPGAA
jgi:5-methyltetrahydrofolate--homocysteine methyltransferase